MLSFNVSTFNGVLAVLAICLIDSGAPAVHLRAKLELPMSLYVQYSQLTGSFTTASTTRTVQMWLKAAATVDTGEPVAAAKPRRDAQPAAHSSAKPPTTADGCGVSEPMPTTKLTLHSTPSGRLTSTVGCPSAVAGARTRPMPPLTTRMSDAAKEASGKTSL